MTPEALAIIAAYLMCSEAAETRLLDRSDARTFALSSATYAQATRGWSANCNCDRARG